MTLTTNVIVNNRLVITNTYPDGGTKIETFYRDGRPESVFGTAVAPINYYYGAEQDGTGSSAPWREFTLEVHPKGSDTNEWTKTYTDGAGRAYKIFYSDTTPTDQSDNPYRLTTFDNLGRLISEAEPGSGGVVTLYDYNSKGERVRTAIDMDPNGSIDTTGSDRITDTIQDVLAATQSGNSHDTDIQRTRVFKFTTTSSDATNIVGMTEASTDGLKVWRTIYQDQSTPVTTLAVIKYGTGSGGYGYRTNVVFNPDVSSNVTLYLYGRMVGSTNYDNHGNQVTSTAQTYDAHGRVASTIDARNGPTIYGYNNADLVTSTTSPNPGLGTQVRSTAFDTMGRPISVTEPDNSVRTTIYYPFNLPKLTWGSHSYPIGYAYGAQLRMLYMTNWQSFAANSGTEVTRWNWNDQRGWLDSKDYCDPSTGDPPSTVGSTGPNYTYSDAGRLLTRVWKRGTTTTYSYNNGGDLSSVSYSDGTTPGVTYTYDRRGRRTGISQNGIATTVTFNDADQQLTESYSGGILDGLSMNSTLDANLRLTTLEAKQSTTVRQGTGYAYDYAGRLGTVTDNSASSYTMVYGYEPNSMLVSSITSKQSGSARLTTTKKWDLLNRLTSISSVAAGSSAPTLPIKFEYSYNAANQRVRAVLEDGSYWIYSYDNLGQVTSGKKYWADGSPVDGQQFEYGFDDIGNRRTTGGRASAASAYTVDKQNKYSQKTNAPYVDVLGIANPTASVTVNTYTANRHGEYFHYALNIANSSAAYPTVTVASTYGSGTSSSGKVYVPPATESFSYDDDGNLTADGRWTYSWDGENRLTQMIRDTDTPTGAREKLVFAYDYMGRRIRKQFYTYSSGWVLQSDTIFLYDGWNLICEFDASSSQPGTLIRSYIWGTDLSGAMQGAGGVGGLLKVTDSPLSSPTHHFVAYDGNGNVAALTDGASGTITARYEYGPFAEPLRTAGSMAKKMPLRFSTKYTDNESGLVYYGYRYYDPRTGRWNSRDPRQESGGLNIYGFVRNNPLSRCDRLGLDDLHSATGGEPHYGLLPRRHNSYLTFHAQCPAGSVYTFDHLDYSGVAKGLLEAGFTQQDIDGAIREHGGLGGDASDRYPPKTPNCDGNPVSANAYMESRFTNPAFVAIEGGPMPGDGGAYPPPPPSGSPDLTKAIDAYVKGTTLYYRCLPCCQKPLVEVWIWQSGAW